MVILEKKTKSESRLNEKAIFFCIILYVWFSGVGVFECEEALLAGRNLHLHRGCVSSCESLQPSTHLQGTCNYSRIFFCWLLKPELQLYFNCHEKINAEF